MIDWNECTPLTRSEFDDFIGAAIPFLKDMEMKNGWDFFVNYDLLVKADWSQEDATLRKDKGSEIWKLVLDKVNSIADTVL